MMKNATMSDTFRKKCDMRTVYRDYRVSVILNQSADTEFRMVNIIVLTTIMARAMSCGGLVDAV